MAGFIPAGWTWVQHDPDILDRPRPKKANQFDGDLYQGSFCLGSGFVRHVSAVIVHSLKIEGA
jgi:hypothetical protein